MLRRQFLSFGLIGLLAVTGSGCKKPLNEKQVYKVTGKVLVDGNAAEGVLVGIHDQGPFDTKQPTSPSGQTDAQGSLIFSTYAEGDGLPPGDYKLTFTMQEFNLMSRSYSGPDKLKKKYSDPKTTTFTVKVEGAPVDLGDINLSTK